MYTNLGGFCVVSLHTATGATGNILSQKLNICGRQFEQRKEQSSLLRVWGRKRHRLKRLIFENANCCSYCGHIHQHSAPGWNRSVGVGFLKGSKTKWGFCFWGHPAQTKQLVVSCPWRGAAGNAVGLRDLCS